MIIIGSQEVRQRWVWQLNYHSKLLCQSSQGYKKEVIWIQRIHFCVSFCFIVFTPSTMHKTFRHNIVHFSLLKTITISECLKIVFDAVFFRRSLISGCFSLHLGNYFFLQDNHDDMSTLDLFGNLYYHVPRSFVLVDIGQASPCQFTGCFCAYTIPEAAAVKRKDFVE